MPKKKKKNEEVEEEVEVKEEALDPSAWMTDINPDDPAPSFEANKVECPQHKQPLTIEVDPENPNRQFAVCTCNVRSNMWKGRVVWEHTSD